jgi:hypothetical protein
MAANMPRPARESYQDIPQEILAEGEGELRRVLGVGLRAPGRSGALGIELTVERHDIERSRIDP